MALAGLAGLNVDLTSALAKIVQQDIDSSCKNMPELALLYAEECGWVLEVLTSDVKEIQNRFTQAGVPNHFIGSTKSYGVDSNIPIACNGKLFYTTVKNLYKQWERISFEVEKLQANTDCAIEEFRNSDLVAVLREEGINSDREMMACLLKANFEVHDVTMSDLLSGWVGGSATEETEKEVINQPDVALLHNKSERFECRWSSLRIADSKAMMLSKLVGSVRCWVAHGEGRFSFRDQNILDNIKAQKCVAMHYVDDNGKPTETYPMNPNGSTEGIAGLCSQDGRHLALMPHPERCFAMHQWPTYHQILIVNPI
ncbi:Phosphoribosylformylglycinamidine synthase [Eumeta japonica]|uniref:Phosphoribosylformylglycinamidine synthase n=1 Tax=Eumeta variegata TaxID=151549 RepID=A0A4C2AD47_EUMVA|nr:Phosphoribosylformylglycinamidine synthase [Eumeta japonica]